MLAGIELIATPAATCPRYVNVYDDRGNRSQRLLAPGEPLCPTPAPVAVDVLFVAPAFHELAGFPTVAARVRAASLQGPLRATDSARRVVPHAAPLLQAHPYFHKDALLFFSEEDTPDTETLARAATAAGAIALVTRGTGGAVLYERQRRAAFPAMPARLVDPTGAGDCFAMAFALRYAECHDLVEAMRFALVAGALSVEAAGMAGVPSRTAVDRRMKLVPTL